jgi:hypothetical protein
MLPMIAILFVGKYNRSKFHEMQVDENPFPNSAFVNTLELSNPKVLIRPDQAENAKGKNVIIGKQRHDER